MKLLKEIRAQFSLNEWLRAFFNHVPTAGKRNIVRDKMGTKTVMADRKPFNETAESWYR